MGVDWSRFQVNFRLDKCISALLNYPVVRYLWRSVDWISHSTWRVFVVSVCCCSRCCLLSLALRRAGGELACRKGQASNKQRASSQRKQARKLCGGRYYNVVVSAKERERKGMRRKRVLLRF